MAIFKGVCTAIVTPFTYQGKIDYCSLQKLVTYQLNNNIDALVVLGTTGESSTISFQERAELISFVKNIVKDKLRLIVGVGSNNTQTALSYLTQAQDIGVDACLVVTPYYNKCTQYGAYQYYKTLNDNSTIPLIVYNVPSRTGFNLSVDTICQLFALNNIVGIKEASLDINHIQNLFYRVDNKLDIYCGNDNLNSIFKLLGASGTISVTSNAYPQLVKKMWAGDQEAIDLLYDINNLLFVEPNPIPIKFVLSKLGFIKNVLRPPLTRLSSLYHNSIKKQIAKLKEYL